MLGRSVGRVHVANGERGVLECDLAKSGVSLAQQNGLFSLTEHSQVSTRIHQAAAATVLYQLLNGPIDRVALRDAAQVDFHRRMANQHRLRPEIHIPQTAGLSW